MAKSNKGSAETVAYVKGRVERTFPKDHAERNHEFLIRDGWYPAEVTEPKPEAGEEEPATLSKP